MRTLTKPSYNSHLVLVSLLIGLLALSNACSPLIALHDPVSYRTALDLKVEFKYLVEASAESYASKEDVVLEFRKALEKSVEYEKGRYRNDLTVKQYEAMTKIFDDFVNVWKENVTISSFARDEFLEDSQKAFDQIIILEKAKRTEGIKLKIDKTDATSAQTNN